MTYQSSAWLLFGYIAMFGIAQGARGPIVSSLCAKIFPGRGLGTIYGTIYACMSIGAALGSLVSGVLHDMTGGYQASFYFSMISLLFRSEEHTSELQSLMRNSYAVFCLKKKHIQS